MVEQGLDRISFPPIAAAASTPFRVGDLSLRPFGATVMDLAVDFNQSDRPSIETQVLACCTCSRQERPTDSSFFWSLEVSQRIECLLLLSTLGDSTTFTVALRCLNSECHEPIEVELGLAELMALQRQAQAHPFVSVQLGEQVFRLRRPSGLDQRMWLEQVFEEEAAMVWGMIQSLLLEPLPDQLNSRWLGQDGWVDAFNQAMEEMDPLVNFRLGVNCPYCETQKTYVIDLGALALQRLQKMQQHLLRSIHRLARHYHWSEAEILAIPRWRRDYYLTQIEQEVEG
jgi:hypothetical protein